MAEGFNAQQDALLHSRKLYCTTESFVAQQKSQSCGRNQRKVPPAAEIGEKFLLRQKQRISPLCSVFPWTLTQCLRTTWQRQNGTLKPILWSAWPDFLLRKRNAKRTLDKHYKKSCYVIEEISIYNEYQIIQIILYNRIILYFYMLYLIFYNTTGKHLTIKENKKKKLKIKKEN